jgi:MYXO-CTERM domain-containing protein
MNVRTLLLLPAVAALCFGASLGAQSSPNYELDKASTPGAAGDAFSSDFHASGSAPESVAGDEGVSPNYRLDFELTPEQYGPEDTDPPVITSGPDVIYISDTIALIQWETDELADGIVEYGLTDSYGQTEPRPGPYAMFHQVLLTGLTPNTLYHFRVSSTDPFMNGPTFSADDQFTTAAVPDTDDPIITNVTATAIAVTSIRVEWETDVASSTLLEWGNSATLGNDTSDPAFRTNHSHVITGLAAGTEVFFDFTVTDPSGNSASNGLDSVVLPGAVVITTTELDNGRENRSYSQFVVGTGGVGTLNYSISGTGALPSGLTLNPNTGEISGTPEVRGTYTFSVQVTDSGTPASIDSRFLTIEIRARRSSSDDGCSTSDQTGGWWLFALLAVLGTVAVRRVAPSRAQA